MKSALVALSGGVDSSVALLRSLERFESVRACHVDTGRGCSREALDVASSLGVGLIILDAAESFTETVVEPSRAMLCSGLTPNPCAMCNALVKLRLPFGMLAPGEVLVTGHYAVRSGSEELLRGCDLTKDQSYFLSLVPAAILQRCCFPLGESLKKDVRREATDAGLPFRRQESMDLCFDLSDEAGLPATGDLVDMEQGVVGKHNGIAGYTIGQRKGLGAHGEIRYVISIERDTGNVVIGPESCLCSAGCTLGPINWLRRPAGRSFEAMIQTRYRRKAVKAGVEITRTGAEVSFFIPEKAVAPGQVGALYLGNRLLGGGIITSVRAAGEG